MSSSDHEINRGVRSVLTRHWVDLSKTAFASRRGIVRVKDVLGMNERNIRQCLCQCLEQRRSSGFWLLLRLVSFD